MTIIAEDSALHVYLLTCMFLHSLQFSFQNYIQLEYFSYKYVRIFKMKKAAYLHWKMDTCLSCLEMQIYIFKT